MIFIELTVDAFGSNFANSAKRGTVMAKGAGADSVRRPLRGIEIKDDTYAMIRVIRATGEEIPLISSSYYDGSGESYTNFMLQSVVEDREEKSQILETFGIPYIFLYGERPRMLQCSAILLNTLDFNWEAEFWANYEKNLRGTKCAENGARIYMFYDDNIVEGYMLHATATKHAGDKGQQVALQFSLLLTNYANVSMIENSRYPIRPSAASYLSAVGGDTTGAEDEQIIGQSALSLPWLTKQDQQVSATDVSQVETAGAKRTSPLRSDITDNIDEWTGDGPLRGKVQEYNMAMAWGFYLSKFLSQFIQMSAASAACQRNIDANNPAFLQGMGLLGAGAGAAISAQVGASASFNVGAGASAVAFAGASAGASASAGAYAGAGAWAGAGVGPGGAYTTGGSSSSSAAGAGAGYYSGQGVGYNPFGGSVSGGAGRAGYYPGSGYFGPGQYGTPGFGAGSAAASTGFGGYSAGAGAYAGWSPGTGSYSGSYSYAGQSASQSAVSPGYAGPIWMPSPSGYAGYGTGYASSGASAGVVAGAGFSAGASAGFAIGSTARSPGYTGGSFYGGYSGTTPYAAPGYSAGGYGYGTSSQQYYAGAYAGWDPVNGSYSGSYAGSPGDMSYSGDPPPNTSGPIPGQPGGGLFTTQSFPTVSGKYPPWYSTYANTPDRCPTAPTGARSIF